MKRTLIAALLLCLLLAGCGDVVPAPMPTVGSLPQPVAPEAQDQTPASEDDETDVTPPPTVLRYLPRFTPESRWAGGAVYADVSEADVEAYVAQLEAAGFQSCMNTVFYTDRLVFILQFMQDEGRYSIEWFEAKQTDPVPDWALRQARESNEEIACVLDQTPDGMYEATGLRRLLCFCGLQPMHPNGEIYYTCEYVLGESACVPIKEYYLSLPLDPLWADLDGDGTAEYLYWTSGPTSGLNTVALWAYGTERGVPVVKAQSILNLPGGEVRLEQDGETVSLRYAERKNNSQSGEIVLQSQQLLPLRIEDGVFVLKDNRLPDNMSYWGGPFLDCTGLSFQALRERVADQLIYDAPHCIVWSGAAAASSPEAVTTYAAVTGNGVSVTGYLSFQGQSHTGVRNGVTPIETPDDLDALTTLDVEELEARFGPFHFDNGSGLYLAGWFTEDGKLLYLNGASGHWNVHLYDLSNGETPQDDPLELVSENELKEPDVVTIRYADDSGTIEDKERWQAFLTATANGQPDAIIVQNVVDGEPQAPVLLSFNGREYWLGEGETESYRYLVVDDSYLRDPGAPRHTVVYMLSDDPGMTNARYTAHALSSTFQPDFPPTAWLFITY